MSIGKHYSQRFYADCAIPTGFITDLTRYTRVVLDT